MMKSQVAYREGKISEVRKYLFLFLAHADRLPLDIPAIYHDIINRCGSAQRDCHAGRVRAMPPAVN
jgi:hypothetical protein